MATLNLGSFVSSIKPGSVLGYYNQDGKKKGQFGVFKSDSLDTAVQVGNFTVSGNNITLNLGNDAAKTAVTEISASNGKNWNITSTLATAITKITLADGNDTVSLTSGTGYNSKLTIDTGAGNDVIALSSAAAAATIKAGNGNDSVYVGYAKDDLTVDLGAGRDSLTVADVKGNLTISASGSDANSVLISSVAQNTVVNITMGSGADTVKFDSSGSPFVTAISGKINLGAGKDYLIVNGSFSDATVTSGAGDKNVSVKGSVDSSSITLGAGNDSVYVSVAGASSTINAGDGNDKIDIESLAGASIYGGAGKDVVSIGTGAGLVDLGAGDDSINLTALTSNADVTVTAGAGKDTINVGTASGGTITLTDYSVTEDFVVLGSANFASSDLGTDGTMKTGGGASLKVNGTNGYYAVNVVDSSNNKKIVGWGGENSAVLNASGATESVVLYGTASDAVDTLVGGSKSDTLYLGDGDYADGGKGNDSLIISKTDSSAVDYVGITSTGGKDSVSGFTAGSDGDVVYLYQNNLTDAKLSLNSSSDLVVKVGNASMTLETVSGASDVTVKFQGRSGSAVTVDYVNTSVTVASDTDEMADIYYAGSSSAALDFQNVDSTLVVDLNNRNINAYGTSLSNSSNTTYYGKFASVTGGSDTTILMGSATDKNTLTAGTGNTSLWGGGSKADLLVGGTASDDNNVTYYYGVGDGNDTISAADWGNGDGNDVLWLASASELTVKNNGTDTTVRVSANDKLTIAGLSDANTVVKFTADGTNVSEAKVAVSGSSASWTYDENVQFYLGGTNNSLTVGSDVDGANIWLDGSTGKGYSNVTTVDASSNSGTVSLAGGANSELLVAGSGESSLWGGSAGNDTLQGGSGQTTFFFGKSNGNDVIASSGSDDKVVLYDVALSDFAGIDTSTSGQLKATLTDGSTLTIQNVSTSSVGTFQLGDGSTWKYDASTGDWTQA